jgi:hypothetical protein
MFDRMGISTLLVVSGLVCGCGGKERVTVSATVHDVQLSVEDRALGTFLAGEFQLLVTLGPNAPRSTTVTLESFSLVRASDQTELIATLPLEDAETTFELNPGGEVDTSLVLDAADPIGQGMLDDLCAEPVQIQGTVTDTESEERSTPVQSGAVTVDGCS